MSLLQKLDVNKLGQAVEREMCRRDPVHWFMNWAWTYDPRAAAQGLPAYLPFDLFPRQVDMVRWFEDRLAAREDGVLEKSRDIGFTWVAGGLALHKWLFVDGFKTTFGSRKEEYVDRLGDPDSIFEKIRLLFYRLPVWMRPVGFNPVEHDNHLRFLNPVNGNVIRGEAGDQMGRGGRSAMYIIDEAAFVERAERVDASTSANTDVRIWASTVNGMGNLFARKRFGGGLRPEQIFRFHWMDDPRKTSDWAEKKRADVEEHVWASEYDIDYAASVEGIFIPAKWVEAARRAEAMLGLTPSTIGIAGLDVGAGKAKSVFVARFGPIVRTPIAWGDPDTIETANRGLDQAENARFVRASDLTECAVGRVLFDNIGVGRGVTDALAHNLRNAVRTVGVNVGMPPSDAVWPDGETSKDKFANLKAEAWSLMRERFKATHEAVLLAEGREGGQPHTPEDCIALPSYADGGPETGVLAAQLSLPKRLRNERGRIIVESKAQMAARGISSPDYAEALALTFAEKEIFDASYAWAA